MLHDGGIAQWDGTSWTFPMSKTTDGNPGHARSKNGVLYVSFDDEGVVRWDLNSASALSSWSTANSLHSDEITEMMISGNQLLFASPSNGLARYDWSSGFWLSTWNDGNWLSSNSISEWLALVQICLYSTEMNFEFMMRLSAYLPAQYPSQA